MSLPLNITENNNLDDVITEKKNIAKKVVRKVEKNNFKYIVLLKFLNAILANIGKNHITEITQFININRIDIIKQTNVVSLNAMESELFPLFNKKTCGYYRKTDGLVHNCLRGMIKEIGYTFSFKKKDVYVIVDGTNFRKTENVYSII